MQNDTSRSYARRQTKSELYPCERAGTSRALCDFKCFPDEGPFMSAMRLFVQRHWTAVAIAYATLVCATAGFVIWTVPAKTSQPTSDLLAKQTAAPHPAIADK